MNKALTAYCESLEKDIKNAYEGGVTMEDAEKSAAKFLEGQLKIARELSSVDLDARMKKSGLKAIKAAVYLDEVGKTEKKPSDTLLEQVINMNDLVQTSQTSLDRAEVDRDSLQNYFNVFKEAHVFFRTVARGSFNG